MMADRISAKQSVRQRQDESDGLARCHADPVRRRSTGKLAS